ncbi:MAG: hypothetical protein FWB98_06310 [Defluviitaleaceae bacterium]|nr:hypothetical protein [Defluviitaleaceae bacterium]
MDLFLELSQEQFGWLRRVVTATYGEKVKFAKDWEDGIATVIIFENGSYIWCLRSEMPYIQGKGTFHFPRFNDRNEYYAVHERLKRAGLAPTDIGDFSDKSGVLVNGERVGQYTFLSFNVEGQGLNFELCMEPDHDWAVLQNDEWEF